MFGQILLSNWKSKGTGGALFNSWDPTVWNSYCFLANNQNETVQAFLNDEKIFESFQYEGQHVKNSTKVFLLNSKENDSPLPGSLTDLQIWNKNIPLVTKSKNLGL